MRYPRDDPGHDRLVTVDIETTATDPAAGELVSVGVGVHDRTDPLVDATYETFHRRGDGEGSGAPLAARGRGSPGQSVTAGDAVDDEAALVDRAMARLAAADADALVTYNGSEFDLPFIEDRLDRLGAAVDLPAITDSSTHVDLFLDRKRRADDEGRRWPRLEECLDAYGHTPAKTVWRGEPLTNARFGEELGPAYLRTLGTETGARFRDRLTAVVDHYLIGDLEATLALYHADIGEPVEGRYLGTEAQFD